SLINKRRALSPRRGNPLLQEDQVMFRALTKLCLVGAPVLALACTGQIADGTATGPGPSKPGKTPGGSNTGGGNMETPPGGGNGNGNPTTMPPNLDPPATISGSNKCMTAGKPGP